MNQNNLVVLNVTRQETYLGALPEVVGETVPSLAHNDSTMERLGTIALRSPVVLMPLSLLALLAQHPDFAEGFAGAGVVLFFTGAVASCIEPRRSNT